MHARALSLDHRHRVSATHDRLDDIPKKGLRAIVASRQFDAQVSQLAHSEQPLQVN
jgi:hypothetical protein